MRLSEISSAHHIERAHGCRSGRTDSFCRLDFIRQLASKRTTRRDKSKPHNHIPSLLSGSTLVEGQLVTLEDVAVDTTGLAGSRADDGVQSSGLELALQCVVDLAHLLDTLLTLLGDAVGHLLLLDRLALLLLTLAANAGAVVGLVPGAEGSGVDLHDGRLGEGVGAHQLVVGRVVRHHDHTGLARDALGAPAEVARVETQSAVFGVAATGADEMDALAADAGVGWLTALLESSGGTY